VQPHWLATPPPPQVCGAAQVPQLSVPPQPSAKVPQLSPAGQLLAGVQTHVPFWHVELVPQLVPFGADEYTQRLACFFAITQGFVLPQVKASDWLDSAESWR